MLNSFIKDLYAIVHESLNEKDLIHIKNKAQSFGILQGNLKGEASRKQRLIFLISQHIAYYIDLHVHESQKSLKNVGSCNINSLLKKRNQNMDQTNNRNHTIQFSKAVFLHHYICGPYNIYKSVKIIENLENQLLKLYEIQQITLQAFKQNERIKQIANQRHFKCICKYPQNQQASRCQKCMKNYHPDCQYQKLVCNRCFLSQYFYPIESSFFSKFGQKRRIFTYFHSKFRCFNPNNQKKSMLFAIKFDIEDFQDLKNAAQPQFIIKIMNFKKFGFNVENSEKWRSLNEKNMESSIFLNFNRFEFFLNFFQLVKKHLYFRDENSLIFKLENRLPKQKDNILMIKCDPAFFQDETYEIGIYRIGKIKKSKIKQNNLQGQSEMITEEIDDQQSKSIRITSDQFNLLQKFQEKQNKSENQNLKIQQIQIKKFEEEDDEEDKGNKVELVRSYGCRHKQGFNLAQLKKNHKKFIENSRQAHQTKDIKKHIEKLIKNQLFRQYKKHALRTNIKTQQDLPFNQNNQESILRYCIDNELIKFIEIPQLENIQKNLVDNQFKKILGTSQFKNSKNKKFHQKNKKQAHEKEEKKYRKFAKCPICNNYLSALYLLPSNQKQGYQIKISKPYRNLKKNNKKVKELDVRQTLLEMFTPKSIFNLFPNKKQEESDECQSQFRKESEEWHSQFENIKYSKYQNESQYRQKQQNYCPNGLLMNQGHRQIFEESIKSHKIYICQKKQQDFQNIFKPSDQNDLKMERNSNQNQNLQEIKINYQFQAYKNEQNQSQPQRFQENQQFDKNKELFKVMSEESSSSVVIFCQKIKEQNIVDIIDSENLQQLSFDSPIVQETIISLNTKTKMEKQNVDQKNTKEINQEIIEEKKQWLQISDPQNEDSSNSPIDHDASQKLNQIRNKNQNKIIYCHRQIKEQKKATQLNQSQQQKEIIQISLLSEQQEQGEIKIQSFSKF